MAAGGVGARAMAAAGIGARATAAAGMTVCPPLSGRTMAVTGTQS